MNLIIVKLVLFMQKGVEADDLVYLGGRILMLQQRGQH